MPPCMSWELSTSDLCQRPRLCRRSRKSMCPGVPWSRTGASAGETAAPARYGQCAIEVPVIRHGTEVRLQACSGTQVSVSGDRVLPLASFRGTTRPVLLAGSRSWLQRTMQVDPISLSRLQIRDLPTCWGCSS